MAIFGTPNAFLGLDIGSSSLKFVELVNRHRRIEVVTYAQANVPNLLLHPPGGDEQAAVNKLADTIAGMLDRSGVSTDAVVAALPSSVVFSTVLQLPRLPDKEMDSAVHTAARDVVPADLDSLVLGWSGVGQVPHMDTDKTTNPPADLPAADLAKAGAPDLGLIPVFVTAAPRVIVERYLRVITLLKLQLQALEVETFPLVRSLFDTPSTAEGLIADIGDQTTTFHIIDGGTPRVSHTVEEGGATMTQQIASALNIPLSEAEQQKITHGLSPTAPPALRQAIENSLNSLLKQARNLVDLYASQSGKDLRRSVIIGGGANLKGLANVWETTLGHKATIGNPWRGLAYPQPLENRLQALGPTFAVAVGLAERGVRGVQ